MEIVSVFAVVLLCSPIIFCIALIVNIKAKNKLKKENVFLHEKYKDIIDIDKAVLEAQKTKLNLSEEIQKLTSLLSAKENKLQDIKKEIDIFSSDLNLLEHGIYQPVYDFAKSEDYKIKQAQIIDKRKALIKENRAIYCNDKTFAKVLLRCFNGETEGLINKVKWNNIEQIKVRFDKLRANLEKIGNCRIFEDYYNLMTQELILEHEYNLKKQEEKEEQRAMREALREEEKARKDYEKAQEDAERKEMLYVKDLAKIEKEFNSSEGEKRLTLQKQIDYLKQELEKVRVLKERAISMAQQTKRGNVYIISNIGSFGENVYKIGMTRRLEPMDRIKELGDASVPFPFDIHAMIYSENAPELETYLHHKFADKKLNMINPRKEFFNVTIDEIKTALKEDNIKCEITTIPEAAEYRETQSVLCNK